MGERQQESFIARHAGQLERYALACLFTFLGSLVCYVLWGLHRSSVAHLQQEKDALAAARIADAQLPLVQARDLFSTYKKDPKAAIAIYSGRRYRIDGLPFDAHTLAPDPDSQSVSGFAQFTAGSGDTGDRGDQAIELYSAPHWGEALSTLKTGQFALAACTVDPGKKGIASDDHREYLLAFDCSGLVTDFETKRESPFRGN